MIIAEAPGKLVITGEYAVLAGAPGIAVAMDARAVVRIEGLAGSGNRFLIPETGEGFGFSWVPGEGIRWEGKSPAAFGMPLAAVSETLAGRGMLDAALKLPACRVEISTESFYRQEAGAPRQKLGLGSSSAVIVALTGALLKLFERYDVDDKLQLSCEAHQRLQAGAGSGIDVATSLVGGTIGIRFTGAGELPQPHPLSWPRSLHLVPVWSGHGAATQVMLVRLAEYRRQNVPGFNSHMARLGAAATRALAAWEAAQVSSILTAVQAYDDALRELDADTGIGIWTDDHQRLSQLAADNDAVYKPSGAGGGDFGIALTDSADTAAALRTAYAAAGYLCSKVAPGAGGLSVREAA